MRQVKIDKDAKDRVAQGHCSSQWNVHCAYKKIKLSCRCSDNDAVFASIGGG